jgi:hypothetical protein
MQLYLFRNILAFFLLYNIQPKKCQIQPKKCQIQPKNANKFPFQTFCIYENGQFIKFQKCPF